MYFLVLSTVLYNLIKTYFTNSIRKILNLKQTRVHLNRISDQ